MKIQQIKVNFVRLPLEEPLVGAPYMPGMLREFFTVQVQTDEGIEGIGITGFGGKLVRALRAAIEDFGELIKGDDPLRTEQVIAKLRAASASCGSRHRDAGDFGDRYGVVGYPRQSLRRSAGAAVGRLRATRCRPMPAAR